MSVIWGIICIYVNYKLSAISKMNQRTYIKQANEQTNERANGGTETKKTSTTTEDVYIRNAII